MTRYAIFEDEQYALQRLQRMVERLHPDYQLVHTGSTVGEAIDYFRAQPDAQLVFMDAELADGNCFEIFDEVNVDIPIIFTTAYDEYVLRAFKLNSIDYLLKPLADTDLALALAKYERLRTSAAQPAPQTVARQADGGANSRIRLQSGDNYLYADLDEVAYLVSEDNYVFAYLTNGKHRLANFSSIADAAEALPPANFYQLTRSVIASISSIKSVSKYFRGRLLVKLAAGTQEQEITVSSSRREDFLNWLGR